jgi:hypothetical protein
MQECNYRENQCRNCYIIVRHFDLSPKCYGGGGGGGGLGGGCGGGAGGFGTPPAFFVTLR